MRRPAIQMSLYGPINNDGRVQRSAVALSKVADVTVVDVENGCPFQHSEFRVHRVRIGGWLGFTWLCYLSFCIKQFWYAVLKRPNIVYGHDFFMAFPGWVTACVCGAKFVYDAHELIIPTPGVRMSFRERIFYVAELMAVRRADIVIAANEERARAMQEHYGLKVLPATVQNIPVTSDKREVALSAALYEQVFSRETGEAIWCIYQGYISDERPLENVIEAIANLGDPFRLLIVGNGDRPYMNRLRELVHVLNCDNRILFPGSIPREQIPPLLDQCQIGVLSYRDDLLNVRFCAPNKLYEYAQASLPSINIGSDYLCRIVEKAGTGVGLRIKHANPHAIADALRQIIADSANYEANCGRFMMQNNWQHEAERLRETLGLLDTAPQRRAAA